MKYIQPSDSLWGVPTVHITRAELETLLRKLDYPDSQRTLILMKHGKPKFVVVAVPK
jgi:hypothetical protein